MHSEKLKEGGVEDFGYTKVGGNWGPELKGDCTNLGGIDSGLWIARKVHQIRQKITNSENFRLRRAVPVPHSSS